MFERKMRKSQRLVTISLKAVRPRLSASTDLSLFALESYGEYFI